jgi:hypothetical protein
MGDTGEYHCFFPSQGRQGLHFQFPIFLEQVHVLTNQVISGKDKVAQLFQVTETAITNLVGYGLKNPLP